MSEAYNTGTKPRFSVTSFSEVKKTTKPPSQKFYEKLLTLSPLYVGFLLFNISISIFVLSFLSEKEKNGEKMRNKAVAIASVLIALGAFMWLWTNERMWLIFASLTATTMFFSLSYCFYLEKKKRQTYSYSFMGILYIILTVMLYAYL